MRQTKWVLEATSRDGFKRFEEMVKLFRQYGDQYGFPYLLLAAQAYRMLRKLRHDSFTAFSIAREGDIETTPLEPFSPVRPPRAFHARRVPASRRRRHAQLSFAKRIA
jgi:hypothetical protein